MYAKNHEYIFHKVMIIHIPLLGCPIVIRSAWILLHVSCNKWEHLNFRILIFKTELINYEFFFGQHKIRLGFWDGDWAFLRGLGAKAKLTQKIRMKNWNIMLAGPATNCFENSSTKAYSCIRVKPEKWRLDSMDVKATWGWDQRKL